MERRPQHLLQSHYRSTNSLNRRVSMTCNCIENPHHRHVTLHSRAGTLRCASNPPVDSKNRPKRDFRFQVIELREGPKWFIWPSNKSQDPENNVIAQSEYDQENQERHRSRSQIDKGSHVIPIKNLPFDGMQTSVDVLSEPSTSRGKVDSEQTNLRTSPASLSSGCSNQSSLSSASTTFQILSVSSKYMYQSEEDVENGNDSAVLSFCQQDLATPLVAKEDTVRMESGNN